MPKRDTRELILATSLGLFNELGEPHVTTNHIADAADISPGNLYYHFNNKQDIVLELFKRFIVQLDPVISVPENTALEAEDFWFQLHLSFELKGQYRFLYRNLVDLAEQIPNLGRAFRGLFRQEHDALATTLAGLEQRGALQITPEEKSLLLNNLMLALNYWLPFASMFENNGLAPADSQARAIAGVLQMVLPYLREPEHDEMAELMARYLQH